MAVSYATGFEAQQAATDNISLVGTASYSTAQKQTGAASVRCNPATVTNGYIALTGITSLPYLHFSMYVATLPSSSKVIAGGIGLAGQLNLRLSSTGALELYDNATLLGTSATTPFASPGWHWVGFRGATGTSVSFVQIDGSDAITGTATVANTTGIVGFGAADASSVDAYFDDIVIDSAGFLGPSKVDIALPISDFNVTFATAGAGGTTNLWQAVDNVPPAGVASASETNTSNIRFPASPGGTATYEANLETYTTLGVGASDTIIGLQSILRHGEDIATGTKNGSFTGITSNGGSGHNNTSQAFTFGNDGGAHGAEVGLWATKFGDLWTSSFTGITFGNSPRVAVQRVNESRVGCVDYMGLLVVWTPAVVAAVQTPYVNVYPPFLAQ